MLPLRTAALSALLLALCCIAATPASCLFLPDRGSLRVAPQKEDCVGAVTTTDPDSITFLVGVDPAADSAHSTSTPRMAQLPSVDPQATSWPDLVNFKADDVKAALLAAIHGLRVQIVKKGQPVTMDYSLSRVRLMVDEVGPDAVVLDVPRRG